MGYWKTTHSIRFVNMHTAILLVHGSYYIYACSRQFRKLRSLISYSDVVCYSSIENKSIVSSFVSIKNALVLAMLLSTLICLHNKRCTEIPSKHILTELWNSIKSTHIMYIVESDLWRWINEKWAIARAANILAIMLNHAHIFHSFLLLALG